jgi:hypothetical protein
VLHLAGGITLGVDVGDFLQLQRAFERDRIVDAAAQKQEVGAAVEPLRNLFHARRGLDSLLDGLRQVQQLVDVAANLVGRQRAADLRQYRPSSCSATSCDVNAFVEATPISGPAWV